MDRYNKIIQEGLAAGVLKRSNNHSKKNGSDSITLLSMDDIHEVALLSQIYFPGSKKMPLSNLEKTIEQLYFTDGELNSNSSSIVSRSVDGSVNGFLGVISSPFQYKEREITVANCHHLMATEQARTKLVPMKLLQKFLSGPQDLSFADNSSESTRLLWKRLGGEPAIGESIFYKVPLKPLSFALRPFLKNLKKPLLNAAALIAKGTDTVSGKIRLPWFYRNKPAVELRPLNAERLTEVLNEISSRYILFPLYDQPQVDHLLHLLRGEMRYGTLHTFAIVDDSEGVTGWFIYYSLRGGICEVIQAVCLPGKEDILFDSLTWHAYEQGGIELSGRLMANQFQTPFTTKAICM
ncbi:MAG: hypothetical protein JJU37_11305, partial [Balneolaceae bacterium]|nr:hypothetical protein [Balneolaceae bacterium]